jgi:type IX secretion system PorP/SprF family membrane protein
MNKLKKILLVCCAFAALGKLSAQDPSFSQFFASPLNVNPALTGNIDSKWRAISNYRSQWKGPGNPYRTGTASFDGKIFQDMPINYVDEITRIAVGGMLMYDEGMGGALKSNYASFNVSGNIRLASMPGYEPDGNRIRHLSKTEMNESAEQRLGVGLGVMYGRRQLDVNKLTFEDQFTGNGFDTNLPTGEAALSNMKPFVSATAGLLYSYIKGYSHLDVGVAGFHLNRPKQSFLSDDKQTLAPRYVAHSNFETYLSDQVVLNANGIYQYQSGASYFSVGGALGYYLPASDDKDVMINGGIWYWSNNAIIPYVGFSYGNVQLGLTYDITISDLRQAPKKAQTFELCMILRGFKEKNNGVIPAPWR